MEEKHCERRQLDDLPWGAGERDPGVVGHCLSSSSRHLLPKTPLNSLPMQKAQTGGGELSWAELRFAIRLTYGKEEEVSGVCLCHVKSLLVRVVCSKWIPAPKLRKQKDHLLLSLLRGTRIWVSPPDASTPSTNPIFARTKEMHPDCHPQVCFAVFNGNFDSLSPLHSVPQLHSQLGREEFAKMKVLTFFLIKLCQKCRLVF